MAAIDSRPSSAIKIQKMTVMILPAFLGIFSIRLLMNGYRLRSHTSPKKPQMSANIRLVLPSILNGVSL